MPCVNASSQAATGTPLFVRAGTAAPWCFDMPLAARSYTQQLNDTVQINTTTAWAVEGSATLASPQVRRLHAPLPARGATRPRLRATRPSTWHGRHAFLARSLLPRAGPGRLRHLGQARQPRAAHAGHAPDRHGGEQGGAQAGRQLPGEELATSTSTSTSSSTRNVNLDARPVRVGWAAWVGYLLTVVVVVVLPRSCTAAGRARRPATSAT